MKNGFYGEQMKCDVKTSTLNKVTLMEKFNNFIHFEVEFMIRKVFRIELRRLLFELIGLVFNNENLVKCVGININFY